MTTKKIAIFASGGGSNAEQIIAYLRKNPKLEVALIISNRKNAFVLERAKKNGIPSAIISNTHFKEKQIVLDVLRDHQIDYVVLAGFLLLIPTFLIEEYPEKIINIHPALLPKYGGKGMYGQNVHQAVFDNFEQESGITIHLVNENYDEGKILFQEKVKLETMDTPDIIASKVLELEHRNYARIIEEFCLRN